MEYSAPRRRPVPSSIALLVTLAVIASCGDSPPATSASTLPATTVGTTTSSTTSSPTTTEAPEVWDLVWITDSLGWGVSAHYRDRIEADLGVSVRVHDFWAGGLSAAIIRDHITTDGQLFTFGYGVVDVYSAIRDAEVIVVAGNAIGLNTGDWNCDPYRNAGQPCGATTDMCGRDTWVAYEDALGEIFDRIFELRDGDPVVLRTLTWWIPFGPLERWRECDRESVCTRCWGEWAAAIHRAAGAHGVPVADLLVAFSGEDLDLETPREYVRDGHHPSPAGAAAIAAVIADLGYELVYPTP